MEVHSHTHTARKKITHYLWEFIMLFLAVFCGFLAENIREHKVERHREKEYISSLVRDLEYDTLKFQQTIVRLNHKIPFYDSVFKFIANPSLYNNKLPFDYYIQTNLERIYSPAEPTIQQLKNSGNFRLIENHLVLDSILLYESRINGYFLNQTTYVVEYNKRLLQAQEKIFDQVHFNEFLNAQFNNTEPTDSSDYSLALFSTDAEKKKELYNIFVGNKASEVFYAQTLYGMKEQAASLIRFIKEEYHLQ